MEIKEVTSRSDWEAFIDVVKPNTFLHTWEWGEMEQSLNRWYIRLGIFENRSIIAVAAFTKVTARRGTFLLCSHGPIIHPEYQNKLSEILAVLVSDIKKRATEQACHFVRISTLTVASPENEKVFHEAGFRNAPIHMHAELTSILNIDVSEEELLKNMRKTTRYSIKKAEKDGVTISTSTKPEDVEKFWNVYISTFERNKFVPFSKEYVTKEFTKYMEAGKGQLFFGHYDNKIISAAFIIFSNGSGFYHHGASLREYQTITASHLVQWEALKEAKRRGCARYNFWGMSPEDDKKHPWYGYSVFKKGFGGYYEAYVKAQDYVLSPRYYITYIIERIRKMKRGL